MIQTFFFFLTCSHFTSSLICAWAVKTNQNILDFPGLHALARAEFLVAVTAGKCFFLMGLPPRVGVNLNLKKPLSHLPEALKKLRYTAQNIKIHSPLSSPSQMSPSTTGYSIHLLVTFSTFGLSDLKLS